MEKMRQQQLHSEGGFVKGTQNKEISTEQKEFMLTMLLRKPIRNNPLF